MVNKINIICILLVCILGLVSCKKDKKESKQTKMENIQKESKLPENMVVSFMEINDSVNKIRGLVAYARNNIKDSSNIDLKMVNAYWENDLKEFYKKVQQKKYISSNWNYYEIKIKNITIKKDSAQVEFAKKTLLLPQTDTQNETKTINLKISYLH